MALPRRLLDQMMKAMQATAKPIDRMSENTLQRRAEDE